MGFFDLTLAVTRSYKFLEENRRQKKPHTLSRLRTIYNDFLDIHTQGSQLCTGFVQPGIEDSLSQVDLIQPLMSLFSDHSFTWEEVNNGRTLREQFLIAIFYGERLEQALLKLQAGGRISFTKEEIVQLAPCEISAAIPKLLRVGLGLPSIPIARVPLSVVVPNLKSKLYSLPEEELESQMSKLIASLKTIIAEIKACKLS